MDDEQSTTEAGSATNKKPGDLNKDDGVSRFHSLGDPGPDAREIADRLGLNIVKGMHRGG